LEKVRAGLRPSLATALAAVNKLGHKPTLTHPKLINESIKLNCCRQTWNSTK